MAIKMGYFKRCPDCGRGFDVNKMVVCTEDDKTFEVCVDCYESIHFERTEIWKMCLNDKK